MRGHITERRPGYWQARVYAGIDPVTRRKREITRAVRGGKRDAEKALRELMRELEAKPRTVDSKGTVGYLVRRYLDQAVVRGWSPTTLTGYESIAGTIVADIGAVQLADLRPAEIDAFYGRLVRGGMSAARLRHHHRFLSQCLNQAVTWEWLGSNPAKRARPPMPETKALTIPAGSDVRRLIDTAESSNNEELAVAFRLLAATGCRRGEVVGLRWSDLDGRELRIQRAIVHAKGGLHEKTTKTRRARSVSLDYDTMRTLAGHRRKMRALAAANGTTLAPDAHVLANMPADARGRVPWRPNRLTLALRRLAERAGYEGRLHDLRHSHASELLQAGVPAAVVAKRLGHSTPATTHRIYEHAIGGGDHGAAQAGGRALAGRARPALTSSELGSA